MKDIKTKSTDRAPRLMTDAARAPKELMRRSFISAKEQAKEAAERQQPQSEQPEQYAEERVERTADDAAHNVGDELLYRGKQLARKANDLRKQYKEAQRGTEQNRSSFSSPDSNATRQGRERVRQSVQSSRRVRQASQRTVKQSANTAKIATKGTVKTAQRTVKTTKQTVKAAEKTVKTTQQAAKTAQKTAQAAAKATQVTARAAQAAAKAAAAATKAVAAFVKALIAAVKALIAAIAAGGWVAVVIIIVIVLVIALLSLFGVFSANESADGSKPMTEAIEAINTEFKNEIESRIAKLTAQGADDVVEIIYEGDMESIESTVPNWADVVGVYAIKVGADAENPSDVTSMTPDNIERLKEIFHDMNSVSYRTELESETITITDEYGALVLDKNGDPVTESKTTLHIYVNVASMDYRDGAELYHFNQDQDEMLVELMRPDYYPLFAELLGDTVGDGGEYGCSGLVRAAYRDCVLSSMNGLTSTGMAQKCRDMGVLFTDSSQLQAGDLIFFARKDASRGEGYCTDTRRCGTGRCKRWLQIHHVAIYINDEFLIDSTGGNNSVQIRKHWGKNGSEWEWVCFGRPTN